jgi:DNA polymerase-3 subunit gamma/tau
VAKSNGGDPQASSPASPNPVTTSPQPGPAAPEPQPEPQPQQAAPLAPAQAAPEPPPPASEPPEQPAPRVPTGPPELATVAACWPAVIDLVRKDNQMLAALLADARPVALKEQDVTVAFPSGKAFLKRKAEQDDYRRATAEALRAVIGSPLVLRYELRDEPEPADPAAEPGGLSHEELVKRLVDEFDAQEVLDDDEETQN